VRIARPAVELPPNFEKGAHAHHRPALGSLRVDRTSAAMSTVPISAPDANARRSCAVVSVSHCSSTGAAGQPVIHCRVDSICQRWPDRCPGQPCTCALEPHRPADLGFGLAPVENDAAPASAQVPWPPSLCEACPPSGSLDSKRAVTVRESPSEQSGRRRRHRTNLPLLQASRRAEGPSFGEQVGFTVDGFTAYAMRTIAVRLIADDRSCSVITFGYSARFCRAVQDLHR